jgi:hypothetical protein
MANRQLVLERIAFDSEEGDSRGPNANAHEPAAHATCWGRSAHWVMTTHLFYRDKQEHARRRLVHSDQVAGPDVSIDFGSALHYCNSSDREMRCDR